MRRVDKFSLENFWNLFPTTLDAYNGEWALPPYMPHYIRELKKEMTKAKKLGLNPNLAHRNNEAIDILFLICSGLLDNSLLELFEEKDILANAGVALAKSIQFGNIEALEWLLKHNINPNDYPPFSKHVEETIKLGDVESLKLLVNYGAHMNHQSDISYPFEYILYPPYYGENDPRPYEVKKEMMEFLLNKGIDLSFIDPDRMAYILRNSTQDVDDLVLLLFSKRKDIPMTETHHADLTALYNRASKILGYQDYHKGKIFLGYNVYKFLQGFIPNDPEASTLAQLILNKTIEQIVLAKPDFNAYRIEGKLDLDFILNNEDKLIAFKELREEFKDFEPFSQALEVSDTEIQNLEKATQKRKSELLTKKFSPLKTNAEAKPLIEKIKDTAPNENVEKLDIKRVYESALMEGFSTENIIGNIEQYMELKDKVGFHLTNHPFREAKVTPSKIQTTEIVKKMVDIATQTDFSDTGIYNVSESSVNTKNMQSLGETLEEIS